MKGDTTVFPLVYFQLLVVLNVPKPRTASLCAAEGPCVGTGQHVAGRLAQVV